MSKKIMFSDKYRLTQAVLNGTKTMTRRLLKAGIPLGNWKETEKMLPYNVGEVVAIAQSYKDANVIGDTTLDYPLVFNDGDAGYCNKMFVKATLMPHHIKITDIKIEHLQDISDEDCLREGIRKHSTPYGYAYKFIANGFVFNTPRDAFATLIDKINGKGTWERNPWVVAYSFELVD